MSGPHLSRSSNRNAGFDLLRALIVLIILGGVLAGGWYLYTDGVQSDRNFTLADRQFVSLPQAVRGSPYGQTALSGNEAQVTQALDQAGAFIKAWRRDPGKSEGVIDHPWHRSVPGVWAGGGSVTVEGLGASYVLRFKSLPADVCARLVQEHSNVTERQVSGSVSTGLDAVSVNRSAPLTMPVGAAAARSACSRSQNEVAWTFRLRG